MAAPVIVDGAWSLQQKNTALHGRLMVGSLLMQQAVQSASVQPLQTWRSGVLVGSSWQGAVTDGSVVAQSGMNVLAYAAAWVVSRAGQGPYIGWNSTNRTLTVDAANGSNPRRDLVVARVYDSGIGDASLQATYELITGTAAASPADPVIPVGAIPLARITVGAGATSISAANITDLRKATSVLGAPRVLLGGDTLADGGYLHGELRFRKASGSLPDLTDYWGSDGAWHGMNSFALTTTAITNVGNGSGAVGTTQSPMQLAIPDPGWPYKVMVGGTASMTLGPSGIVMDTFWAVDSKDGSPFGGRALGGSNQSGASTAGNRINWQGGVTSPVLTGAHTIYMVGVKYAGPSGNGFSGDGNYASRLDATVMPA